MGSILARTIDPTGPVTGTNNDYWQAAQGCLFQRERCHWQASCLFQKPIPLTMEVQNPQN